MTIDFTPSELETIIDAIDHSIYDTNDLLESGILDIEDHPEELVFCKQLKQRLGKLVQVGEKILEAALAE